MNFQVRDPVHSFIRVEKKEADLVATPVMQRLRGIRQLAMASLVYPGALHTRFEHSLGVFHIACQMAELLGLDEHAARIIRYAALLHDIGHGPFSHVSENALEQYADRSTLDEDQKREKIHELITARILLTDNRIRDILGRDDCNDIVALLGPSGWGEPVNRGIVSGPLDADKQDYLLRDSHFCGVQYGIFDIHQMLRSLVAEGDRDDRQLMIKEDGIHAIEQFVLAKYYLTSNVYRHKVRLITDQMITRAIVLGVERDGSEKLEDLYAFDNSDAFVKRYLHWDDARFMETFCPTNGTRQGKCQVMLQRLRDRRLLKRVFRARPREFSVGIRESVSKLGKPEMALKRQAIEARIAELLSSHDGVGVDADFVIAHSFNIKSVRTQARNDDVGILVATSGDPQRFEDESALFRSIDEGENEESFEVYAPAVWSDRTGRDKVVKGLRKDIMQVVEETLGSEEIQE
jgi:HD superfamily phosphohydrolase